MIVSFKVNEIKMCRYYQNAVNFALNNTVNISRIVRKTVLGVYDQVRPKLGCTATADG